MRSQSKKKKIEYDIFRIKLKTEREREGDRGRAGQTLLALMLNTTSSPINLRTTFMFITHILETRQENSKSCMIEGLIYSLSIFLLE